MGETLLQRQYYEWFVSDCFMNSIANIFIRSGLDLNILLCDYFSFIYHPQTRIVGANYPLVYNLSIYLDKRYRGFLNQSYEFIRFCPVIEVTAANIDNFAKISNDRRLIQIRRYKSTNWKIAWERLKRLIDKQGIAICAVDAYYLKYHEYYHKRHAIHYVNLTGYNESKGFVELFDRYRTAGCDFEGRMDFNEFITARESPNPSTLNFEGISGIPIANLWFEVEIPEGFLMDREGQKNIILKSIDLMINGKSDSDGYYYGIPAFEQYITWFEENIHSCQMDIRFYCIYHLRPAFKNFQRHRARFANFLQNSELIQNQNQKNIIITNLLKSSANWETLSNLIYKYGATRNPTTIASITKRMREIMELERQVFFVLKKYPELIE